MRTFSVVNAEKRILPDYDALRRAFSPPVPRIVIIAESPPKSGTYFYNPDGRTTEALFSALMKLLEVRPRTKREGLEAFRDRGWMLLDAVCIPVNGYAARLRDTLIAQNYPRLITELKEIIGGRDIPVLLVKANVCRLLGALLTKEGVHVMNNGAMVPFPSCGNQKKFHDIALRLIVPFR